MNKQLGSRQMLTYTMKFRRFRRFPSVSYHRIGLTIGWRKVSNLENKSRILNESCERAQPVGKDKEMKANAESLLSSARPTN